MTSTQDTRYEEVLKHADSISDPVMRAAHLIQRGPPRLCLAIAQTTQHVGTQHFIARIRDEDYVRRALLDNSHVAESVIQRLTRDSNSVTRALASSKLSERLTRAAPPKLTAPPSTKTKRRRPATAGRQPTSDRVKCDALLSLIAEMRQKKATLAHIAEVLGVKRSAVSAAVFSKRLMDRPLRKREES